VDLKTITDIFYHSKRDWKDVSSEEKERFFFIFNRYMSRKYPLHAQQFNFKGIDKAIAFNVWFVFFRQTIRRPDWFWPRAAASNKNKIDIAPKDMKTLVREYEIKEEDVLLLHKMYPKELRKDLLRINKINEELSK
jgi:hypothetical protein